MKGRWLCPLIAGLALLSLGACSTPNYQPELGLALYGTTEAAGCALGFTPVLVRADGTHIPLPSRSGRYVSAQERGRFLIFEPNFFIDLTEPQRVAALQRGIVALAGVPTPATDDAHYRLTPEALAALRASPHCR